MSFTAQWQRWWPLAAAGVLTALAFVIQPGLVGGMPPVVVALVAVLVAGALWGVIEMIARQFRQADGRPLAVYPLHRAYAAVASRPLAWLLTTPSAYGWLVAWLDLGGSLPAVQAWQDAAGMTSANTIVVLPLALALLVSTGVLLALVIVRRSMLGLLSALVFAVLLALSGRLHLTPPAEYALIYGSGLVVGAGAAWWCRRHPRSIDPRTENRSA